MKFLVVTDLHQGMKHQKDYDLEQIRNFAGLKINLGDNFDSNTSFISSLQNSSIC